MVTIHLAFLVFSIAVMIFADKQALSWVLGRRERLDERTLQRTHLLMWVGLGGMIITGVIMASSYLDVLMQQPYFIGKMLFVGILFTNGIVIGYLTPIASTRSFASLSTLEKIPLLVSGAASLVGWVGAFVMAKLMFG
jgi:hypothetical protein